jgi:nucleotide-binding universal stress UspA family protein
MDRFKNILFASSGGKDDRAALDRASRLAIANRARLTLVCMVEELPKAASYFLSKQHIDKLGEGTRRLAMNHLVSLAKKVDPSIRVETRVLTGKAFIELIRAVVANSHDLIIKPKQRVEKGNPLDSSDLHLLRKCPCPVWIINSNQRKPFGKILIAVDPDPSDRERLALHADLLKIGTSLARSEHGEVEAVHTWSLYGEATMRGPRFKLSNAEIEALAEKARATHQEWLDRLIAPYAGQSIKTRLIKGPQGPALVEYIEKKKPDIVVMGTVARTGLPGLLIGNTAEFVLGQISCSVLAIKPKGFKTPVK